MAGEFRAQGGDIVISVDVEGEEDAELLLAEIAANLENLRPVMFASAAIAREDMKRRFDTETDPDEEPWQELDPEYLRNKLSFGYPADILHRTGDLETSATGGQASFDDEDTANLGGFRVVGDSLYFDTSVLPPYGILHQNGTGQENVGLAREARERHAVGVSTGVVQKGEGAHDSLGIGRGNALPRRAFIGLSEAAEVQMYKLWDLWFEDATNPGAGLKVSGTGALQHSIGGRFGPRIIL